MDKNEIKLDAINIYVDNIIKLSNSLNEDEEHLFRFNEIQKRFIKNERQFYINVLEAIKSIIKDKID